MHHRRLGRTNLEVSALSLGTVELGLDYGISPTGADARPDEAAAARLLNRALDLGINYLDTARLYGTSEQIIGRALSARRSEFFLATKVPLFAGEGLSGEALRARLRGALEESLAALRTDVIDVMMLHSVPAVEAVPGEVQEVLEGYRDRGAIRFVGASVYGPEQALAAIECGRYDCVQIAYSPLDRRPERAVFAAAAAHDVGLVIRSVLLKGALTHRAPLLPDELGGLKQAAARLDTLASAAGLSLPELAYRYVLAQPAAHTALVGTVHLAELEAVAGYAAAGPLPPDLVARVQAVSVSDEAQLNPANWPS